MIQCLPCFQVIEPSQVLFSLETLIITVSAGAVAALVVGFVTGYCCGRRCHKDSDVGTLAHLGYPDAEYEYFEQRANFARPLLSGPVPGMPGGHMVGGPLMPTETSKLDNRQEEVKFCFFINSILPSERLKRRGIFCCPAVE